jgi:cell division protein FtsB
MLSLLKKAFLILGLALFVLVMFLPGFSKVQELRDKNRDLEAKIKDLSVENSLLEEEMKRLEFDPVYQEQVARERMGVVRKGEIPVKVIPVEKE